MLFISINLWFCFIEHYKGDFYKLQILQKKERVSYVKIVSFKPNS